MIESSKVSMRVPRWRLRVAPALLLAVLLGASAPSFGATMDRPLPLLSLANKVQGFPKASDGAGRVEVLWGNPKAKLVPVDEPGTGSSSGTGGTTGNIPDLTPAHPDARNTATCNYHGTTSPSDATYAKFASSLVGLKGNKGLTLQSQVEYHHVGGASVVIIENGAITQHHWYGCQDRPAARRTTANTIYSTASLSKFVSSIGLVIADRQKVIDLDRTVQSYANAYPNSLLADWVDDKFRGGTESYPQLIPVRRLLNHTAGLDTDSIGVWPPGDVPSMVDVFMGTDGHNDYFDGGIEPLYTPKTRIEYSGGGFIVAEHILQLASPLAFKDYLKQNVFDAAGLSLSTFETAQTSMTNLARPYSCENCGSGILQTTVKAASGLLANAREYAELVVALANGGVTSSGRRVMQQSDVNTILTPAANGASSFKPCSNPGATTTIDLGTSTVNVKGVEISIDLGTAKETCVAGQYRRVLYDGSDWSGLGVELSTTIEADGYPRVVDHGGDEPGSRTYFKIDRSTGDGIVIMINGDVEWVDGDGLTYGAEPLMDEIKAAYAAAY
ncbi:serine hydrolase domain-containing protein [Archangium lansingense]|uniref:Serine hydrolase n=1 Tax=Archangium lansingense TaxID=2995310 RepID=A0ABT4A2B0_9BACT|nr:serine hydrolase domain-containing protein [Archangium lansinium]MCY1075112.1 serine hydrolase [Archangium lansinium]